MPDLQISAADERFLSSSPEVKSEAAKPATTTADANTESTAAASTATPNEEPTGAEAKPGEEGKKAETVDDLPPWQKALISKEKSARQAAERERDEAREQARKALDVAARVAPAKPAVEAPKEPTPDQFDSPEAYEEARIEWRVEQKVEAKLSAKAEQEARERQQRAAAEVRSHYDESVSAAQKKYADFAEVALSPALHISQVMAEAIITSDNGPEVQYWLGKNPAEAQRIAQLSPIAAVREIGRIEAKLAEAPAAAAAPKAEVSKAPKPTTTVTGSNTTVKASSELSIAEIDAADKAERRKRAGLGASP